MWSAPEGRWFPFIVFVTPGFRHLAEPLRDSLAGFYDQRVIIVTAESDSPAHLREALDCLAVPAGVDWVCPDACSS